MSALAKYASRLAAFAGVFVGLPTVLDLIGSSELTCFPLPTSPFVILRSHSCARSTFSPLIGQESFLLLSLFLTAHQTIHSTL